MSETQPALTSEQWMAPTALDPRRAEWVIREPMNRHALAARALHGQPFGFTWEDVEVLRIAARHEYNEARRGMGDTYDPLLAHGARRIESIADRIAALLPPREQAE